VVLGLTKGEILLVLFIFGLIYTAGFLPRVVKLIVGEKETSPKKKEPSS